MPAVSCGLWFHRAGRVLAARQLTAVSRNRKVSCYMRFQKWFWVLAFFVVMTVVLVASWARATEPTRRGPLGLVNWTGQLQVPCPSLPACQPVCDALHQSEPWSPPVNQQATVAAEPEVPAAVYTQCTIGVVFLAVASLGFGGFVAAKNAVNGSTPR